MTPQEVKSMALQRAIKTLADLEVTYTIEAGGDVFTNRVTRPKRLDWSRYDIPNRMRAAKAGDILEIRNQGSDLGDLQRRAACEGAKILGAGNFRTELDRLLDSVTVYVFASPVLEVAA